MRLTEPAIPAEVADQLRAWQRQQALFTLNLTAEALRIFQSFATDGIEALVIKGPVLSFRCYGDAGLRQYGDLDLIVRQHDILRATEVMIGLDYAPRILLTAIQANKIPGEYVFRQARSRLLVEFHTELTFRYHPRPLPLEALYRRQVRVPLDGNTVPALSPEDELVLICIHGAKHFWERLIYIADVAAFLAKQPLDWDRLHSAAREVAAERMLSAALALAAVVLEAPLPAEIASRVRSDRVVAKLTRQIIGWLPAAGSAPPGIAQRALFRIRMRGGILSGIPYLLRLSVSPTEEDWAADGASRRHWLLDALGRPFRLARKYGRDGKE